VTVGAGSVATFGTLFAAAAALVLAPQAASAQAPASASASDVSARKAKALELARLVEPRTAAGAPDKMEAQYIAGLLAMEEIAELEAEYPGVVQAMWRAIEPEIDRDTAARLPAFWERLADIYSSGMTLEQIDGAVAFMASPTGQKMIAAMTEGLVAPAMNIAAKSEGGPISDGEIDQAKTAAAETMVVRMTQEEQEQIAAFAGTPAGVALLSVAPQVQQATLEWMNMSDPASDARLDALAEKAIGDYIAAAEAAKGKAEATGKGKARR
jgi:hypothetical protein